MRRSRDWRFSTSVALDSRDEDEVAVRKCVFINWRHSGNGSPFVSLPKGSSNNPMTKASDVSATGVPID